MTPPQSSPASAGGIDGQDHPHGLDVGRDPRIVSNGRDTELPRDPGGGSGGVQRGVALAGPAAKIARSEMTMSFAMCRTNARAPERSRQLMK